MVKKTVFYACSAWVGRIDGETRCRFWSQNPLENNFDPALLIPVDLSMTPAAARKGRIDWDQIQVDDFGKKQQPEGTTTIGPRYPDGVTTGMVSLAGPYLGRLRPEIRPIVPPHGSSSRKCEFMSVVYGDGPRAGRRYVGLHAMVAQRSGTKVEVEFQFSCANPKVSGRHWFDLASPDVDDGVAAGGLTEITADPGATGRASQGALFVEFERAIELKIIGLKIPLACGVDESYEPYVPVTQEIELAAPDGRESAASRPSGRAAK